MYTLLHLSHSVQCTCIGVNSLAWAIFKVIAKEANNISYTVWYGLGGKAQFVRNLSCMQIIVIWAEASWRLIT